MTRGVRWYLVGSLVLVALIALAGCSHYLLAERDPWRHEAELGLLEFRRREGDAGRASAYSSIEGPGACGMDYPIRVSPLGETGPLGYDDEAVRPPGAIPNSQRRIGQCRRLGPAPSADRPAFSRDALPPPTQATPHRYPAAQPYPPSTLSSQQPTGPVQRARATRPHIARSAGTVRRSNYDLGSPERSRRMPITAWRAVLFAAAPAPSATGPLPRARSADRRSDRRRRPVEVKPAATLACPIVSALDQWIDDAVQPAALHWFRQPVVEIKQISAYSCRGMNGNPNAHISEHAFGNALDVAEFDLADGHKISVQYGWHGTPEEQGFLHDVQAAACEQFTTVLAPGANVYHYNHIHVDLMRHYNGRHICEPAAIPGEVVGRTRPLAASPHGITASAGVTGSIGSRTAMRRTGRLGYSGEDDDGLPEAVPGDDWNAAGRSVYTGAAAANGLAALAALPSAAAPPPSASNRPSVRCASDSRRARRASSCRPCRRSCRDNSRAR